MPSSDIAEEVVEDVRGGATQDRRRFSTSSQKKRLQRLGRRLEGGWRAKRDGFPS